MKSPSSGVRTAWDVDGEFTVNNAKASSYRVKD